MSPAVFERLEDLLSAAPCDLGATEWAEIDAEAVARFGSATATMVAGDALPPYLLLSLTNRWLPQLMEVPGASSGVNYGADSVRFGPAVRLGTPLRARARLAAAVPVGGGVQTTVEVAVEAGGDVEPACVVMALSRWMP